MADVPMRKRAWRFCARLLIVAAGVLGGTIAAWLLATGAQADEHGVLPVDDAPVEDVVRGGAQAVGDTVRPVGEAVEHTSEAVTNAGHTPGEAAAPPITTVPHSDAAASVQRGADDALSFLGDTVRTGHTAFHDAQHILLGPTVLAPVDMLTSGPLKAFGGASGQPVTTQLAPDVDAKHPGAPAQHEDARTERGHVPHSYAPQAAPRTQAPAPAPQPDAPIQLPHGQTGGAQHHDVQFGCLQFTATHPHPGPASHPVQPTLPTPACEAERPGDTPD